MKRKLRKAVMLALTFALSVGVLAGCSSSDTASTSTEDASGDYDGTVYIAGIAPLTGSSATWGEGAINGYNLAIKEINEAGGIEIDGLYYELSSAVFADDKTDSTEAVSAYNNCASYDISAIIGSCSSSCTLAFVEAAQEAGILVITPYSTNENICKTGDYIFRECFSDADQGPALAELATEEFEATNIAIIAAEDSDYCAGLAEALEAALDEMGVTYVHYGCVTTDTDYTAQIAKAIEQGADIIIYPNNYDTVPNFVSQARDAGYTGPILGGDAWDGTDVTGYEEKFDNTFYLAHVDLSSDEENIQSYVEAYTEEYGGTDGLNAVSSLYYDAVKMLAQAMTEAGSYDPADLKDALANIEYESMGGTITYDENGDAIKPFTIETFIDGELTYYGMF